MEQETLNLLLVQQKKKYLRLNEILDITMQLADALNRDDEVSATMLIAMREEPLQELMDAEACVQKLLSESILDIAPHLRRLVTGDGKETPRAGEEMLDAECQKNYRLLSRIVSIDKPLNLKIAKEKSFYN